MLGVGGTSEAVLTKLEVANPGVWMLNPGGFLLPVFIVSRRGEVSIDKFFMPSTPEDVAGLVRIVGVVFKDRFLTLRRFSVAGIGSVVVDALSACNWSWPSRFLRGCPADLVIDLNDSPGSAEFGVSGEEPGEGSAINGESNVELVVVGEDSVDSDVEATEDTLSLLQ